MGSQKNGPQAISQSAGAVPPTKRDGPPLSYCSLTKRLQFLFVLEYFFVLALRNSERQLVFTEHAFFLFATAPQ